MPCVVVPLDGSELAERALPLATSVARLIGADVRLVQAAVSPTSLEAGIGLQALVDGSRDYLDERAGELRGQHGLHVTTRAVMAPTVQLILEEATRAGAAAVVMSTHGRTGLLRLLMGSVAEGVLRESPIPVYLMPTAAPRTNATVDIRHILVPLDGSALSYSVLAPVTQLAKKAHARITLMRIFGDDEELGRAPDQAMLRAIEQQLDRLEDHAHSYFTPIKAHLRASGVKVDSKWTTGIPVQELLAIAELTQPDLIALATHGRAGLDRLRYGSVTEGVLRNARVPVMTFGPQALKRLARDVSALVDVNPAKLVSVW